ncbi:hypothetical protein FRC07_000228, partial [Ceratobasidium sp. 392]
MFLTPNLLTFESSDIDATKPSSATGEEEVYCELVAELSRTCLRLEGLRVHSRSDLLLPVSGLKHLQSFTINEHGTNYEMFQALAQLPHLEKLCLLWDKLDQSRDNMEPVDLSDDSFPSLRELRLYCRNQTMAKICASPVFFRNLHAAAIHYSN